MKRCLLQSTNDSGLLFWNYLHTVESNFPPHCSKIASHSILRVSTIDGNIHAMTIDTEKWNRQFRNKNLVKTRPTSTWPNLIEFQGGLISIEQVHCTSGNIFRVTVDVRCQTRVLCVSTVSCTSCQGVNWISFTGQYRYIDWQLETLHF